MRSWRKRLRALRDARPASSVPNDRSHVHRIRIKASSMSPALAFRTFSRAVLRLELAAGTWSANFSKFFWNILASVFAWASYASLSCHVLRVFKTSLGTFGQICGIEIPNTGSVSNGKIVQVAVQSGTDQRVCQSDFHAFAHAVGSAAPPGVHEPDICAMRCDSLASSREYTSGCMGRNGAPKQVEKFGCGSVTPRSVPATLAV